MGASIPNVTIEPDAVTDIYADSGVIAAGINVGDKICIEMLGQGAGSIYAGSTPPAQINNDSGYRDIKPGQEFSNNRGDSGLFIYSRLGCTINVKRDSSSVFATLNEAATINGCKFTQVHEFIVDINKPLYVLYELQPGEKLTVELIKRLFKTDSDGADMLILWDYDVSSAVKTPLASFNENNVFRGVKDAAFDVSLLNPSTLNSVTGVRTLTAIANVTSDGIVRESSFIAASGLGSNTTGDVDPALGFRRYKAGTGYLFKVVSRGDANKITVGYTWTETGC